MDGPSSSEETRTIYVRTSKKWQKVTIPASARVTFGPLIPGTQQGYGQRGMYIRIYKTKDHQLAVIPNVTEFRDSSLIFEQPTSDGFVATDEISLLGDMVEKELQGNVTCPNCSYSGTREDMNSHNDVYTCRKCAWEWQEEE